jgi:hypothetical protein
MNTITGITKPPHHYRPDVETASFATVVILDNSASGIAIDANTT